MESTDLIGTRLKQVQDLLDGGLAQVYAELGLPGFRPRYTPVLKVLDSADGQSIRDLAEAVGVTHSAMSQTVAQLLRDGLVSSEAGSDARTRLVQLTPAARQIMPILNREWQLTSILARELEAEMSVPLSQVLDEVLALLIQRPYAERATAASARLQG